MTLALALAALTCWLVRLLASPRWRFGDSDDVRQHLHRLGGQRRLTILGIVLSTAVLVAVLVIPGGENPDLRDLRLAEKSCGTRESPYDPPTCYVLLPGGQWAIEQVQSDGTRQVLATVVKPDFVSSTRSAAPTTVVAAARNTDAGDTSPDTQADPRCSTG